MGTLKDRVNADTKRLLGMVSMAENLVVTGDNRWFVSGGNGFYQIDPNGVAQPQKVPIAFDSHFAPSTDNQSFFFGITQHKHFVYASCSPEPGNAVSPRYIMFMDTMQSPVSMVAIHKISNATFFNGMAADATGRLYLAEEGRLFPPSAGKLVQLTLSSPTTVSGQSDWLTDVDGRPNGIKVHGDTLYLSQNPVFFIGNSHVKKVKIKADGTAGAPTTLFTIGPGKLLDDIELVDGGLLITQAGLLDSIDPERFHNSRFNQIIHINEPDKPGHLGRALHISQVPLSPPSAVKLVPDLTSAAQSLDLIVTERTGMVTRLSQTWGLRPRR